MFPYLNLFGVAIAVSPLLILLGLWLGSSLAEKRSLEYGVDPAMIYNLMLVSLAGLVIGGRLSYAAQHLSAFAAAPGSLFSRNSGLFDPLGGAVVAGLAAMIYAQWKKLKFWPTLDAFTPLLAVLMLAIPIANLANGEAFGAPSDLAWAIELWGESRHPVQIYEAVIAGVVLWLVWFRWRAELNLPAGSLFLWFVAASALSRLVFEGLRGASPVGLFNLRIYQMAAWLVLASAFFWLDRLKNHQTVKE